MAMHQLHQNLQCLLLPLSRLLPSRLRFCQLLPVSFQRIESWGDSCHESVADEFPLLTIVIISTWTRLLKECFSHLVESMPGASEAVIRAKVIIQLLIMWLLLHFTCTLCQLFYTTSNAVKTLTSFPWDWFGESSACSWSYHTCCSSHYSLQSCSTSGRWCIASLP